MKRTISWGIVGGCLAGVLAFVLGVQKHEARMAIAETTTQPADAAQPTGAGEQAATDHIVHTFTDDTGIQEFAKLWQRRQAALTRMAVLQAYVEQEQPALTQLNQELLSTYHLDISKNYSLDTERKVLIEVPNPPPPAPTFPAQTSSAPPAGSQP